MATVTDSPMTSAAALADVDTLLLPLASAAASAVGNLSREAMCQRNPFNAVNTCLTPQFIFNTLIGGSFCLIGLAANSVSFAVLRKDRQAPIASILLQALAFADNFYLFWCLVHMSLKHLLEYVGVRPWSSHAWSAIHTYLYPFLFIGQSGTVWLTVFIAFTRYFAVCRPYSAARVWNAATVRNGVCVIFGAACVYNLPRFLELRVVTRRECNDTFYAPERILLGNEMYYTIYFDYMYYIFSFALPLLLLTYLNIRLIVAYRDVRQRRLAMLSSARHVHNDAGGGGDGRPAAADVYRDPNITLVMIVVILIFIICNLPAKVVQILYSYDAQECHSYEFYMIELSKVLELLNSCTNFAVYCVFRQQFRIILRRSRCFASSSQATRHPIVQTDTNNHASMTLLNGNSPKTPNLRAHPASQQQTSAHTSL